MEHDYLDFDFTFRTIYGEARGYPPTDDVAVGFVICRRAKLAKEYKKIYGMNHPHYGSGTPASACTVAYQFSCWNLGDPNLEIIKALDPESPEAQPSVAAALAALNETVPDPSNGATHYHAKEVLPPWARGRTPCAVIDRHIFYNLGMTA
jgi:spore germination cell wall hydrolase CwlJ-like protein